MKFRKPTLPFESNLFGYLDLLLCLIASILLIIASKYAHWLWVDSMPSDAVKGIWTVFYHYFWIIQIGISSLLLIGARKLRHLIFFFWLAAQVIVFQVCFLRALDWQIDRHRSLFINGVEVPNPRK